MDGREVSGGQNRYWSIVITACKLYVVILQIKEGMTGNFIPYATKIGTIRLPGPQSCFPQSAKVYGHGERPVQRVSLPREPIFKKFSLEG
jgi:hypothetical protein